MQIFSATGYCKKCGKQLINVQDVNKCIRCEANANISNGPTVAVEDPGDEAMQAILKKDGVKIQEASTPTATKLHVVTPTPIGTLDDALKIMKHLSMPDDIKQFKQIKKIIDLLEQLVNKG